MNAMKLPAVLAVSLATMATATASPASDRGRGEGGGGSAAKEFGPKEPTVKERTEKGPNLKETVPPEKTERPARWRQDKNGVWHYTF